MKKKVVLSALLSLAFGSASAVPLAGSTLEFQYYYPTLSSGLYPNSANGTYVVGSGVEIGDVADGSATMDLQEDRIVIDFRYGSRYGDHYGTGSADFNGWVLRDYYGTIDKFTSVTVDPTTTLAGIANGLHFTDDTISLNWKGLSFSYGDRIVLNVATALPGNVSPIPEPSSWAMICVGMLGVGVARRRAKARAAKDSSS